MKQLSRAREAVDRYQQRHTWAGFPLAVLRKYSDDQGGYLTAAVTYYAFFSLFPLLLVFVSVLGFVLRGHAHLDHEIVKSALGQFPVIGPQIQTHSLGGSGIALTLGVVGAVWAGTGVCRAAQNAMDQLWGIPIAERPGFFQARARAFLLLLVLGLGALASSGLSGIGTVGTHFGVSWKLIAIVLSTLLNFLVFWLAFRTLTTAQQTWRSLRGGALSAAIAYEGLQLVGGLYVNHVLKTASNTYGTFALVIGLLSWIYLATHVTLLAAEGNVVANKQLWPRTLGGGADEPPTRGDEEALRQRARAEEQRPDEAITVTFD
ncbi:MAG TPA: YihY/virulence factor BrkB family protein [Gaiellaceae bacterium]|nr:YihY/virulence factor BrkB family protein [Gaiellaceae bacterium]